MNSCPGLTRVAKHSLLPLISTRYGAMQEGDMPLLDFLIHLPALTYLAQHNCNQLNGLPGLRASYSSRSSSRLTHIRIIGCYSLPHLHHSLGDLTSLTSLIFFQCPEFRSLPDSLGGLSSLASLELDHVGLTSLPQSIGQLSSLRVLKISHCPNPGNLPHSIGQLGQLTFLSIECSTQQCAIKLLPGF